MAHRYRLYPTEEETVILLSHCAHARFVWNLALEQANMYRRAFGPTPNWNERSRQLTEARSEFKWLKDGSSTVQAGALQDFNQALKNWWGKTHGRPTWRSAKKNNSFCVKVTSGNKIKKLNRKWAAILIPKLGYVKFRLSRPLPAKFGMGTVKLDKSGRWHISFNALQPEVSRQTTGATVGIDVGIVQTITLSSGESFNMPVLLSPGEVSRKLKLQRKFAKQKPGSNRRENTRLAIAKISAREVDRRKDWIEKTTTSLVRDYDIISIENLNIAKMVKKSPTKKIPSRSQKRNLNRSIHEASWGLFRIRLKQKAAAANDKCVVVAVKPEYTSQRCSECQYTAPENRENQAAFKCKSCGFHCNADVNAAKNIRAAGLAVLGHRELKFGLNEVSTNSNVIHGAMCG